MSQQHSFTFAYTLLKPLHFISLSKLHPDVAWCNLAKKRGNSVCKLNDLFIVLETKYFYASKLCSNTSYVSSLLRIRQKPAVIVFDSYLCRIMSSETILPSKQNMLHHAEYATLRSPHLRFFLFCTKKEGRNAQVFSDNYKLGQN